MKWEMGKWREELMTELREWWEDVLAESIKVWHCLGHMEDLMHAFYLQQGIYLLSGDGESRGI